MSCPPLPRVFFSAREVAQMFGLPYRCVLDAIRAGHIPAEREAFGKHIRVPAGAVEQLHEQAMSETPAQKEASK